MATREFELPIPIGEAAKQTDTTVKQLRYWQERGLIVPQISKCGVREYRYYGPDQIALIKRIKSFMDEGFTLMVAAQKANNNRKERSNEK